MSYLRGKFEREEMKKVLHKWTDQLVDSVFDNLLQEHLEEGGEIGIVLEHDGLVMFYRPSELPEG